LKGSDGDLGAEDKLRVGGNKHGYSTVSTQALDPPAAVVHLPGSMSCAIHIHPLPRKLSKPLD
jgi:hypothetical protein